MLINLLHKFNDTGLLINTHTLAAGIIHVDDDDEDNDDGTRATSRFLLRYAIISII